MLHTPVSLTVSRRNRRQILAALGGWWAVSGAIDQAQATLTQSDPFPSRPLNLVTGYPAGGSVDLVARALAPDLSKRLGQPVVVENIAGASGTIGAAKVAIANPDGYTLLLGTPSETGINHLTNKKLRYDPTRELTPVGLIGAQPMVLVANPRTGVSNITQFIELIKRNPGKFNYASSGLGTPLHLTGELIKERAGLFIVHIPYRGAGPMLTDLLGGQIDFGVFVLSSALPHIQSGKLNAIGVSSLRRAGVLPNVPALAEDKRLSGLDMTVWFGLFAPARTSPAAVERLRRDLSTSVKAPDVARPLQDAGLVLNPDADFPAFIRAEVAKFSRIVSFANIKE